MHINSSISIIINNKNPIKSTRNSIKSELQINLMKFFSQILLSKVLIIAILINLITVIKADKSHKSYDFNITPCAGLHKVIKRDMEEKFRDEGVQNQSKYIVWGWLGFSLFSLDITKII